MTTGRAVHRLKEMADGDEDLLFVIEALRGRLGSPLIWTRRHWDLPSKPFRPDWSGCREFGG